MSNQILTTAILVVVSLGVGFLIGHMTATDNSIVSAITSDSSNGNEDDSMVTEEQTGTDTNEEAAQGTTVSASALTEGQRKLLASFGIDANEINITPQMIACAEAKLGSDRIKEIENGATPSFAEGFELVACYK